MLLVGTSDKLYNLEHFVIGKRGLPLAGDGAPRQLTSVNRPATPVKAEGS